MATNGVCPGDNQRARLSLEASALTDAFDRQAAKERLAKIQGKVARLQELLGMRDDFNPTFDTVTPNAAPRRP